MSYYNAEIDDAGYKKQQWLIDQLFNNDVVVFDVGANIGQSVLKYRGISSECSVYSFEPHPHTFLELQKQCETMSGVRCEQLAVGAAPGRATFYATKCREASSLLPPEEFVRERSPNRNYDYDNFDVLVDTLDNITERHGVGSINILKIDVQGAELGVLQGAEKLLSENRIDIIYSEVLFAENYAGQCDFNDIWNFLKPYGYMLWDLFPFLHTDHGRLWTGNALFVSGDAMKRIDPR